MAGPPGHLGPAVMDLVEKESRSEAGFVTIPSLYMDLKPSALVRLPRPRNVTQIASVSSWEIFEYDPTLNIFMGALGNWNGGEKQNNYLG